MAKWGQDILLKKMENKKISVHYQVGCNGSGNGRWNWHLPQSPASALFIFPKTYAGNESTLPTVVLTQVLLLNTERCIRHKDVAKKILLAGLYRTLDEWLCDSFAELIKEMELWKCDDATGDFWSD